MTKSFHEDICRDYSMTLFKIIQQKFCLENRTEKEMPLKSIKFMNFIHVFPLQINKSALFLK